MIARRSGGRFAKALTKIMRDPRISIGAKALYVVLKTYADQNSHCHPALSTLAKDLDCHRNSVVKWMHELVEVWHIVKRVERYVQSVQTSSDYFIDDEHFAKHCARSSAGPKKSPQGRHKKQSTEVDPLKKSTTPENVIKLPKAAGE